jgi:hypothetical protein
MKNALKLSCFLLVLVLMVSVLPVTAHADPPDDQCPDFYADLNNGGHHEWVLIHEDSSTCTKDGAKYWSCEYCGREHTDYTPALGHSWSAWTSSGSGLRRGPAPAAEIQRPAASRSRRPIRPKHRFPIRKLKLPRALQVNLLQQARTHGSWPMPTIPRVQTGMFRAQTEALYILQPMLPHIFRGSR